MMERLEGYHDLPNRLRNGVVAIGNFDGVHQGHQKVLATAVELARRDARPALVATFAPHPARYFHPDSPPSRLASEALRDALFAHLGIDAVITLVFDAALAALPPERFWHVCLAEGLKADTIVTGDDFHFGRGRAGDITALKAFGRTRGVPAVGVAPVLVEGQRVSSTRIRSDLRAGDVIGAAALLTRPFRIDGTLLPIADNLIAARCDIGDFVRPAPGRYRASIQMTESPPTCCVLEIPPLDEAGPARLTAIGHAVLGSGHAAIDVIAPLQ